MTTPLHFIRDWPSADWLQHWQHDDCAFLVSEKALELCLLEPELAELLPGRTYVLITELALLAEQGLMTEDLPLSLIQISDTRWVELTLQCAPVVTWDKAE